MPIERIILQSPVVVPYNGKFGATCEMRCRFRLPQAAQYVFEARIHDFALSEGRMIPCGQVDVLGSRTTLRFAADGLCEAVPLDEHIIETLHVTTGNGPRLLTLDTEPVAAHAGSEARMIDLLDRWLEAVFLPVPPVANVGYDMAEQVLVAMLHLAPAGWNAERFQFTRYNEVKIEATAENEALRGGEGRLMRNLTRAIQLMKIEPGFEPQPAIGDRSGGTRILMTAQSRTLRIERGQTTGHARLAATSLLQEWGARPGPGRRERAALVARVLRDTARSAPEPHR